ncbi:hypothetical protein [Lysobacter firmicutimachus]|uniref:Uncharacterized protein n=1 Tax=Lysobacter firmicutimachus TaxID=1792846 RepID=A0ABU8CXM4_9GAMM
MKPLTFMTASLEKGMSSPHRTADPAVRQPQPRTGAGGLLRIALRIRVRLLRQTTAGDPRPSPIAAPRPWPQSQPGCRIRIAFSPAEIPPAAAPSMRVQKYQRRTGARTAKPHAGRRSGVHTCASTDAHLDDPHTNGPAMKTPPQPSSPRGEDIDLRIEADAALTVRGELRFEDELLSMMQAAAPGHAGTIAPEAVRSDDVLDTPQTTLRFYRRFLDAVSWFRPPGPDEEEDEEEEEDDLPPVIRNLPAVA